MLLEEEVVMWLLDGPVDEELARVFVEGPLLDEQGQHCWLPDCVTVTVTVPAVCECSATMEVGAGFSV